MNNLDELKKFIKNFLHADGMDVYDEEIDAFLPVTLSKMKSEGVEEVSPSDEYYGLYKYCVAVGVALLIDNESTNLINYRLMYRTSINQLRTVMIK